MEARTTCGLLYKWSNKYNYGLTNTHLVENQY